MKEQVISFHVWIWQIVMELPVEHKKEWLHFLWDLKSYVIYVHSYDFTSQSLATWKGKVPPSPNSFLFTFFKAETMALAHTLSKQNKKWNHLGTSNGILCLNLYIIKAPTKTHNAKVSVIMSKTTSFENFMQKGKKNYFPSKIFQAFLQQHIKG